MPGVRAIRVYRERPVVAVPERHPLASRDEVAVSDPAGETLITYPPVEGPYFHRLVTGLLNVAGAQPAEIQFITQPHSILALAGEDPGVAIVPQAAEKCRPTGVALRPLAGAEGVHADLLLAWREGSADPACAAVLGRVEPHRIAR